MMADVLVANCVLMEADYCVVPDGWLNLTLGDQVRIAVEREVALFTVSHFSPKRNNDDDGAEEQIQLNAKQRLGITASTFTATLHGPVVVNLELETEQEAEAQGEFIERIIDRQSRVICIAPHGGRIDLGSDLQAEFVARKLDASAWICKGYRPGGGAFTSWHVTSNDISPNSFPGLRVLATNQTFDLCLSFHGMQEGGVLVGGLAPLEWKQRLRDLIEEHINNREGFNLDPVSVKVATLEDACNGLSKRNVCNWLTKLGRGGIQLEQDKYTRETYAQEVAQAVVEFAQTLQYD
ncbi:hypothetical protein BASA81_000133 [Batrachochytrium salamandrivorans]|nr:hypothetical protein BASA81_000133 [Batrachochytrium salamandrivorans]